jgi:hypothetical protein
MSRQYCRGLICRNVNRLRFLFLLVQSYLQISVPRHMKKRMLNYVPRQVFLFPRRLRGEIAEIGS